MKKSHYKKKHYKTNYNKRNYSSKSKTNFNPKFSKFLIVVLVLLIISAALASVAKFVPEITIKIKKTLNITAIIVFVFAGLYVIFKTNKKYDWIKKLLKLGKKSTKERKKNNDKTSKSEHTTTDSTDNNSYIKQKNKSIQKEYTTTKKYKRQKFCSERSRNYKKSNQRIESYLFPLELDNHGYFCTCIDDVECNLYRIDLLIDREIEDISQYQVRIRIRIEDYYIQSANLFYNDKVLEQIKVLNPDALQ